MNHPTDELMDHYNARDLPPELVARSFIAPTQFWKVAKARNSVIVGSRGSGKTTLLRMLDPRAIAAWTEADSDRLKSKANYIGVFVPIDSTWMSALRELLNGNPTTDVRQLYVAVYGLAMARSLVDAMLWRSSAQCHAHTNLSMSLTVEQEQELARSMSELWLPDEPASTLLQLRVFLTKRLATLPGSWSQGIRPDEKVRAAYSDPLRLTAASCDIFNALANEPNRKWALLCDELEIAPLEIQQLLFGALRAAPQPLILKLALTPGKGIPLIAELEHPVNAHDCDIVSLSYPKRDEGQKERSRADFCRAMWQAIVDDRFEEASDQLRDPYLAFDSPTGSAGRRHAINEEDIEAKFGSLFRGLAEKDQSFFDYLEAKGVDISDLNSCPLKLRDSVVRKVRPLVEIRSFYLANPDGLELKRISRRSAQPYCGAERIFALSEGHPRWLKYSLSAMLDKTGAGRSTISVPDQSRELVDAVERIEGRVRALAVPHDSSLSTDALINRIGAFFQEQVLGEKFRPDPYLTFSVDAKVNAGILNCLEKALYIGALIPMDEDGSQLFSGGLTDRRFRLSYWLAPLFKLPLATGKAIKLSSLLSQDAAENGSPSMTQYSLELDDET